MIASLRRACILVGLLTVLCGVLYPLLVTGVAQLAFPAAANGSVIGGPKPAVGSRLLGQSFTAARYFWSRPSASTPQPYNGASSGASNFAMSNPAFAAALTERVQALRAADPGATGPVPVDLVTSSASGLDPDISPAAATFQVARVARARGLPRAQVEALVAAHTTGRTFGLLGEPRVNVLELNLALDALH